MEFVFLPGPFFNIVMTCISGKVRVILWLRGNIIMITCMYACVDNSSIWTATLYQGDY